MTTPTTETAELLEVTFREPYSIGTAFGVADVAVGTSRDGQVIVALGPPAADVLARVIAQSTPTMSHPDATVEVDPDVWCGVVVDLLASAALADPMSLPATTYVSGYLPPRGRRG